MKGQLSRPGPLAAPATAAMEDLADNGHPSDLPSIRRTLLFSLAFLACFGFVDVVVVADMARRHHEAPTIPNKPEEPHSATVPIPPAAPPPAPPAPPPLTAATLPPLQETTLSRVPVHSVPDSGGPAVHVSPEVSNGPGYLSALTQPPRQFSGTARVTGPNALLVGTVPVQLFGVKSPARGDRCGASGDRDCAARAERALAARVETGKISCQAPSPKPGIVVAFAICLDSQGTDIAGELVNQGLALADPGQSYDYVGAESIARGQKRGLWAFR